MKIHGIIIVLFIVSVLMPGLEMKYGKAVAGEKTDTVQIIHCVT